MQVFFILLVHITLFYCHDYQMCNSQIELSSKSNCTTLHVHESKMRQDFDQTSTRILA